MKHKKTKFFILITIILVVCLFFAGCIPSTMSKAKKKMMNKGYILTKEEEFQQPDENGLLGRLLFAKKDNVSEGCDAYLYDTEENAKKMLEGSLDTVFIGGDYYRVKYGKWIILGSSQALRDFKSII